MSNESFYESLVKSYVRLKTEKQELTKQLERAGSCAGTLRTELGAAKKESGRLRKVLSDLSSLWGDTCNSCENDCCNRLTCSCGCHTTAKDVRAIAQAALMGEPAKPVKPHIVNPHDAVYWGAEGKPAEPKCTCGPAVDDSKCAVHTTNCPVPLAKGQEWWPVCDAPSFVDTPSCLSDSYYVNSGKAAYLYPNQVECRRGYVTAVWQAFVGSVHLWPTPPLQDVEGKLYSNPVTASLGPLFPLKLLGAIMQKEAANASIDV